MLTEMQKIDSPMELILVSPVALLFDPLAKIHHRHPGITPFAYLVSLVGPNPLVLRRPSSAVPPLQQVFRVCQLLGTKQTRWVPLPFPKPSHLMIH